MDRNKLTKEELEVLLQPTPVSLSSSAPVSATKPIIRRNDRLSNPDEFTDDQLWGLHKLHTSAARRVSDLLSDEISNPVRVSLSSVEVSSYADFILSRPIPCCFAKLDCQPHSGVWVLDIEYQLLFSLIDCLLGGTAGEAEIVKRPLTEIERRLASRLIQPWLTAMEEAWESVLAIDLQLDSIQHNPQQQRIVPPSSAIIWLTFQATIDNVSGPIELCIPSRSIRRVINRITVSGAVDTDEDGAEVVALLGEVKLSSARIKELRVGDLLETAIAIESPLQVLVDGKPTYTGRAGALQGKKAIKIQDRFK